MCIYIYYKSTYGLYIHVAAYMKRYTWYNLLKISLVEPFGLRFMGVQWVFKNAQVGYLGIIGNLTFNSGVS